MDCAPHDSISAQDFVGNIKKNDMLTQAILEGLGIAEQVDIFCGIQKVNIETAKDNIRIDAIVRTIQRFSRNVEDKIRKELKVDDREIVNGGEQLRLTLVSATLMGLYLGRKK